MSNKDEKVENKFKVGDAVTYNTYHGIVRKISSYGVHVTWDNGMFQVFHFNPNHHMQTEISELILKP